MRTELQPWSPVLIISLPQQRSQQSIDRGNLELQTNYYITLSMRKFFYVLMLLSCITPQLMAEMIAISADNCETTYLLSDIQQIKVKADSKKGVMTILLKNDTEQGEFQKILFTTQTTSINNTETVKIYAYPNSVSHIIYIQGIDNNENNIAIYNLNGKCLLQDKGTEIDVSSLIHGTYILNTNNKYIKFIKK